MGDFHLPYFSDDGTLTDDSPLLRISKLCVEAGEFSGRPFNLGPKYKDYMQSAGFVDVVERRLKWPLNQWPKDPHYKEIGVWTRENLHSGIEGILMALFTRHLGWSKEDVMMAALEYRQALKDTSVHGYIPM